MIDDLLEELRQRMTKSVEALQDDFLSIRTGRASPALVEKLPVEYSGSVSSLNQMASIAAPEPRLLVIRPWDPAALDDIERAILKSDLGLNPTSDGHLIRINIPPLTEERRQELIKVVRKRVEERRIAIRNLRREAMEELKQLEKSKDISQDEHKRALDQLQKLTDSFIAQADDIGRDKETELAEV
jgi:ribosome recycling factor